MALTSCVSAKLRAEPPAPSLSDACQGFRALVASEILQLLSRASSRPSSFAHHPQPHPFVSSQQQSITSVNRQSLPEQWPSPQEEDAVAEIAVAVAVAAALGIEEGGEAGEAGLAIAEDEEE